MVFAESIPLTAHEALSGIAGSISLASWIFLLVPQLFENYRQGSAAGVSILFLFVWMIGDITNLAGALWAGLVPTVTALAIYFCFADTILIAQCLYYNAINARRERQLAAEQGVDGAATEEDPLIAPRRSSSVTSENFGLPGSRRRSSGRSKRSSQGRHESLSQILEEEPASRTWLKNTGSVLLIILAGTAGWAIAWKAGAWKPTPETTPADAKHNTPLGAEILGYASAVCYLGARIPQIVKNYREKSCDGLSLLFFLLSVLGNITYGAGILLHSVEKQYFLTNLPWLIGSLGTLAEDAIIFMQFHTYGDKQSAIE